MNADTREKPVSPQSDESGYGGTNRDLQGRIRHRAGTNPRRKGVTANLPFENWTEALGSERLTGAALDRLTHRCHILETKGESYRVQDAMRRRRRAD